VGRRGGKAEIGKAESRNNEEERKRVIWKVGMTFCHAAAIGWDFFGSANLW
jgi:hypothetical protein